MGSGSSWSLVGTSWLRRWIPAGKKDVWGGFVHVSQRHFRFGNSEVTPPLWKIVLYAKALGKTGSPISFGLSIDVPDWGAPLLISRHSLASMGDVVDFSTSDISCLNGAVSPSQLAPGGHLWRLLQSGSPAVVRSSRMGNIFACTPNDGGDIEEGGGSHYR